MLIPWNAFFDVYFSQPSQFSSQESSLTLLKQNFTWPQFNTKFD